MARGARAPLVLGREGLHAYNAVFPLLIVAVRHHEQEMVTFDVKVRFLSHGQQDRMLFIERAYAVLHKVGTQHIFLAQLVFRIYVFDTRGRQHPPDSGESSLLRAARNRRHLHEGSRLRERLLMLHTPGPGESRHRQREASQDET
jgi:hypothetical protein